MPTMTWHTLERAQLVQALTDAGPDAPTLCEGWEARHLAAHIVLRESSVIVGAGIVVPALATRAESAIARLADTASTAESYRELVSRVADGPSRLHPMAWAPGPANLLEFYVHTEDVRRGAGPVPARELEPEHRAALWAYVLTAGALRLRRVPVGVVLVRPDGVRHPLHRAKADRGTVVVRGDVGELVLYLFGRGAAADVRLEGAREDLAELEPVLPSR
jgi:uncharacterized protein (TIGR03085 family)